MNFKLARMFYLRTFALFQFDELLKCLEISTKPHLLRAILQMVSDGFTPYLSVEVTAGDASANGICKARLF